MWEQSNEMQMVYLRVTRRTKPEPVKFSLNVCDMKVLNCEVSGLNIFTTEYVHFYSSIISMYMYT